MRIRSIGVVLLAALLAVMPAAALAASTPDTAFSYVERDDGTAEITGITAGANQGELEIPAELDGHVITAIAAGAFQGTALTGIEVPDGVLSIGSGAFADCEELTFVLLPPSVQNLGEGLFAGSALQSFTVPAGTEEIPAQTFSGCTELASVTVPVSVSSIGADAFSGCTALQTVYYTGTKEEFSIISVAAGNESFSAASLSVASTGPQSFLYNIEGAAVGDDLTVEIAGLANPQQTGPVVIPAILDGYPVTSIGPNAFDRCRGITDVELPESVTAIGSKAFRDCTSLATVTFAEGLKEIGASAFQGCTALEAAALPDSLETAGNFAFTDCTALASVSMPHTMQTPGAYLFSYSGLESFRVPRGWNNIPQGTFEGCGSLKVVTIPASIYAIGEEAFGACMQLTDVYLLGSSAEAESITVASGNAPYENAQQTVSNLILDVETDPDGTRYVTGAAVSLYGTPVSALLPSLRAETAESVAVYSAGPESEPLGEAGIVGTGMTARWQTASGTEDAAQFVLMGDVTGSGLLNIVQLVAMARAIDSETALAGPYLLAADWDHNGTLDIADLLREANLFLSADA